MSHPSLKHEGLTAADYAEELRSLMMRLEILESECDSIRDVMRVIKQDIGSEQKQVRD